MSDLNKLKEVARHSVEGYGRQDINYNNPEGEFVFYSDYEEIKQRLEVAESMHNELSDLFAKNKTRMLAAEAQLAAQLAELAAQEPVSFDALRNAVAEVSGGPAMEWGDIYKGHQAVPFLNFNSLARIVDKFRAAPPAPLTVKQSTSATTLDAATAIRACMDEFPLAVQDIVEECAVIAENTIYPARIKLQIERSVSDE